MSTTPEVADDSYTFNKEMYWKRRKLGLHGTRHAPGSAAERYDARKAYKLATAKALKKLEGRSYDTKPAPRLRGLSGSGGRKQNS